MAEKRFYWLKLKENYFDSPKIKKLRKVAGGDTYTIIYLKMQLLSISKGGVISFDKIEDTFEEELALKLDEQVEDVQLTLAFLKQQSLIEVNNSDYLLVEACSNIGSEGQSAERVRKFRENKEKMEIEMGEMAKSLHCNDGVTEVKRTSLSISNSISNIFNYWNEQNIIKHKVISKEINNAIDKALKKYSEEEIKTYIERYNKVIKDRTYFFDYKWTLSDFLSRKDGISAFTDEGSKWASYSNRKVVREKSDFQQREYSAEEMNSLFDSLDDLDLDKELEEI